MQFTDKAVYVAENNLKVKELLQEDAKYKLVSGLLTIRAGGSSDES